MSTNSNEAILKLLDEHSQLVDDIYDAMERSRVNVPIGEAILLFIASMSIGQRIVSEERDSAVIIKTAQSLMESFIKLAMFTERNTR